MTKLFMDAELAAEYHAAVCCAIERMGSPRRNGKAHAANVVNTLHRFATHPHFSDGNPRSPSATTPPTPLRLRHLEPGHGRVYKLPEGWAADYRNLDRLLVCVWTDSPADAHDWIRTKAKEAVSA